MLGTVSALFTYWEGPNWEYTQWNEIDIEVVPSLTTSGIHTNIIYGNGTHRNMDELDIFNITLSEWHNYAFEWRPNSVKWYVDNVLVRSIENTTSVSYLNK